MRRGARSIYVDYVGYDEIAHHAGMFRPESLAALEGLDRVLHDLERLARTAPRHYRIVVLSDHGQSQGRSFKDRYGQDLAGLCESLMARDVRSFDAAVEGWGRAESIVGEVGSGSALTGRMVGRVDRQIAHQYGDGTQPPVDGTPIVLGSGNLGLFYLPGRRRHSLDNLSARWPRLVPGLAGHPGVGFVAGLDRQGVPWAVGGRGRHNLLDGSVEGQDPLDGFGDHAERVLLRAVLMTEAPDLYVNSSVDRWTADVAAFEDLVGAHGGLGGSQDSAVLLMPAELAAGVPDRVEGADALHRVLVGVLERCGHRAGGRIFAGGCTDEAGAPGRGPSGHSPLARGSHRSGP